MKKVSAFAASALLSTGAFAAEGFSGMAGIGYQTSSIDSQYSECWQECYGDQEPAGFAVEAQFNFGPGLFATLDYADTKDKEDSYDSGNVESEWTDMTVGFGYALSLNDASAVTFALEYSDVDFKYGVTNNNGSWSKGYYKAKDDGVSLVVGGVIDVTEKMTAGASLSAGFAEGLEAFAQYALTKHFALKASYSTKAYELGEFGVGDGWGGPESDDNDADYAFDNQIFRVTAAYTF